MKKFLKLISNKAILTVFALLIQVAAIVLTVLYLSAYFWWLFIVLWFFGLIVSIYIVVRDINPGYKIAWIVFIQVLPLFGGLLYMLIGRQHMSRRMRKRMMRVNDKTQVLLNLTNFYLLPYIDKEKDTNKISDFVIRESSFPLYPNTETIYFKSGEEYFESLLCELKKAKKFIFMEYFIIEQGKFWNALLEVLQNKANEGVDVRLVYDDVGCLFRLPSNYSKRLNALGIKTMIFNPLTPTFDIRLNNRTHRKITVIDGIVSFTGGVNIADEYINEIHPLGLWKDTGMKFSGVATWSFTVMFLSIWESAHPHETDYYKFLNASANNLPATQAVQNTAVGFVQPLTAGPGRNNQVIESAFLHMIGRAEKYVYINTPYLILDNELVTALCLAAKSGIDVRISLPHIPDKKMIFIMTRSFYPILLKAGVKIYEFKPGFLHAKSFISDDSVAYIGTCNLDYRSLYLHYECGAMLYDTPSIFDMKNDYLKTQEQCIEVSLEMAEDVTLFTRAARSVLRVFAPML